MQRTKTASPTWPAACAAFSLMASGAAAAATPEPRPAPDPEIVRPLAVPQARGVVHSLRTIPEACVRIDGRFATDGDPPYEMVVQPKAPCQPRARFEESLATPPSVAEGWILNDVIRVPRADQPACIAILSVWRHPGALAPIEHDGQQRVRLYLDRQPAAGTPQPRFFAQVETSADCMR